MRVQHEITMTALGFRIFRQGWSRVADSGGYTVRGAVYGFVRCGTLLPFSSIARVTAILNNSRKGEIHSSFAMQSRGVEHREIRAIILVDQKEDFRTAKDKTLCVSLAAHSICNFEVAGL